MRRVLPYPLLALSLLAMWILLNGPSPGHVVLGSVIAVGAACAMAALQPVKPRLRRWHKIPWLIGLVLVDILWSNVAVAAIILKRGRGDRKSGSRRSGFVTIPLDLRDRTGLAVLACIITSTPGTVWVEYRSAQGWLLIHVLDLTDDQHWIDTIKQRYERLLMEIFE